jgi:multidrug efflux pump subunit AcrA (membrane-fusion protein)
MSKHLTFPMVTGIFLALCTWCIAAEPPSTPGQFRIKEIEVKIAQIVANSTVEIELAKLALRMQEARLARLKRMGAAPAAAQEELEQAEIEVRTAEVNLKAAEERRWIRRLELERAVAELDIARAMAKCHAADSYRTAGPTGLFQWASENDLSIGGSNRCFLSFVRSYALTMLFSELALPLMLSDAVSPVAVIEPVPEPLSGPPG